MSSESETPEFLAKKEFMTACQAEGTDKEVCERLWLTTTSYMKTTKEKVAAVSNQLNAENDQLKEKLRIMDLQKAKAEQMTVSQGAIIESLRTARTVKDQEEAYKLSQNIHYKSKLHGLNMPIYYLTSLPLQSLRRLSRTFDSLVNKAYDKFEMKRIIADSKKTSQLTAGFYDRNLKRFVTQ